MARKGAAIRIGQRLMRKVGIPLVAERIIREALYRFMKDSSNQQLHA
jgi:ATP-dependent RNA circularization protein (DNA/RNA ligase family)